MDCAICCETFNQSTRKTITCNNPDCEIEVCKTCVRTYLLGNSNDPHCMKCKTAWDQEFLISNLNRSFCKKDYKDHRMGMLLERELSKMPESMVAAEKQKTIDGMHVEIQDIDRDLNHFIKAVSALKEKKAKKQRDIWRLQSGNVSMTKKKFIMPCSVTNCRGFLSSAYKCEICEIYTCPDCLVPIGENRINNQHVCDEKTKENAQFIKETCKACPGMCGEFIFKIDGCDQMWCTTCHTAFSWRTGEIERGVVHNPHYYAALQNGGGMVPRAPGDVVCGGLPDFYHEIDRPYKKAVRKLLDNKNIDVLIPRECYSELKCLDNIFEYCCDFTGALREIEKDQVFKSCLEKNNREMNIYLKTYVLAEVLYKELSSFHRQANHISIITLADERTKIENYRDNEALRVDYLLSKISKEKLADIVYRSDIKRQKAQEELYIWELISNCSIDMFRDIASKLAVFEAENHENVITKLYELLCELNEKTLEFKKLLLYCNNEFKKVSITYGLVTPFIRLIEVSLDNIKDRGILRHRGSTQAVATLDIKKNYLNMLDYINGVVNKQAGSYYKTYNRMILSTEKWTNKQREVLIEESELFNIRQNQAVI